MSRLLSLVDRIILFILGVVLIALGAWPILLHFQVPYAEYLAEWVNHDAWAGLPAASWWPAALSAATVVLAVAGLWLIIANLRHRRFSEVPSAASNEDGAISTNMNAIAGAVAATLATTPGVQRVNRLVAYDRERQALQYVVLANPDTPLEKIRDAIVTNERDFREAFPDADLETVYKIHYTKVGELSENG